MRGVKRNGTVIERESNKSDEKKECSREESREKSNELNDGVVTTNDIQHYKTKRQWRKNTIEEKWNKTIGENNKLI
jgi:uncharacterized membrane protein YcaP (DUF421 family)